MHHHAPRVCRSKLLAYMTSRQLNQSLNHQMVLVSDAAIRVQKPHQLMKITTTLALTQKTKITVPPAYKMELNHQFLMQISIHYHIMIFQIAILNNSIYVPTSMPLNSSLILGTHKTFTKLHSCKILQILSYSPTRHV